MDHALAGCRHRVPLGGDFSQLAPDDEDEIGFIDQIVGNPVVPAEQAGAERIHARYGAFAGQGMRHRDIQ